MAKFYWDIDQGSAAWADMRSRIPTASMFSKVMTPKKMLPSESRKPYACQIIAARLLNWQPNDLKGIAAILEGREREPEAVKRYEFVTDTITRPVGFVTTNDGRFGASPDRIIGYAPNTAPPIAPTRGAEVKCPTPPIQMERLIFGLDDDYKCQVQGQNFVGEFDASEFYSYHPNMPQFHEVHPRDETFIQRLRVVLNQFHEELEEWTELAKSRGAYEAYAAMVQPADLVAGAPSQEELASLISGELGDKLAWGA